MGSAKAWVAGILGGFSEPLLDVTNWIVSVTPFANTAPVMVQGSMAALLVGAIAWLVVWRTPNRQP